MVDSLVYLVSLNLKAPEFSKTFEYLLYIGREEWIDEPEWFVQLVSQVLVNGATFCEAKVSF